MSAARWIKEAGASVALKDGGGLVVGNLTALQHGQALRVLDVARRNKPAIIAELRGDDDPSLQPGWVQ